MIRKMLNEMRNFVTRKNNKSVGTGNSLLLGVDIPFVVNEAYNSLRINIGFALSTQKSNIFLISSPVPGDGKSTVAANTALSMAKTGSKVLIIDSDMRKPTQHKLFSLKNERGLSTLISGMSGFDATINKDVCENLDIITAGHIPPNPSELISSDNMTELLKKISALYDYVIIDTPPINIVSDALVLSKLTAGLVLVTSQNSTTYDDIRRVLDSIDFADSRILGVVINKIKDTGGKRSRYGGKYSYSYKYGYIYGNKNQIPPK